MPGLRIMIVALAAFAALSDGASAQDMGVPAAGSASELDAIVRGAQDSFCIPPDPACPYGADDVQDIVVTGSRIQGPSVSSTAGVDVSASITNNQVSTVDEGDLVKASGDNLIILRRGRLFTVSMAGGRLRSVESIDAYPPGQKVDEADWYDEMLVFGDWVVVIGFSYEREGSEINRFRLSPTGELTFVDSHLLQSNDYFSGSNYATRLVGRNLVLYTPMYVGRSGDPLSQTPTLSRWKGAGVDPEARPLVAPTDVHIPPRLRERKTRAALSIHSIIRCDLTAADFACEATAVLGPDARSLYVAPEAVYLWLTDVWWWPRRNALETLTDPPSATLYRIPLDGSAPTAVRAQGSPIDQFSFREDMEAGVLDVLVVSEGLGDAMGRPAFAEGDVALLRLPLSLLADGSGAASPELYRPLPAIGRHAWRSQNRFIGRHLLYSARDYDIETHTRLSWLHVVPLDGGAVQTFRMAGDISVIETLGRDALAVSEDSDGATFTTVGLMRSESALTDRYVMRSAETAETRSHAFFYKPDADSPDGATGVLGLAVMRQFGDPDDDEALFHDSADMAFLRRSRRGLASMGFLTSRPDGVNDDGCVASCVDWYGNARPIFVGGRIFALLGYELVEGRVHRGRIREVRRVSFAPPPAPSVRY